MKVSKLYFIQNMIITKVQEIDMDHSELMALVKKPKYNEITILGEWPSGQKKLSSYKVGDIAPFEVSDGFVYLKTNKPCKAKDYSNITELTKETCIDLSQKYLEWIQKSDALNSALAIKFDIQSQHEKDFDNDRNYRVLHHSFKIYYCRDKIFSRMKELLSLLNIDLSTLDGSMNDNHKLIQICKDNYINEIIVNLLTDTYQRTFCNVRNEPNAWAEDSSRLIGSLKIVTDSLMSVIKVIEEINAEDGLLFKKINHITWDMGTFIHLWNPLYVIRSGYINLLDKKN